MLTIDDLAYARPYRDRMAAIEGCLRATLAAMPAGEAHTTGEMLTMICPPDADQDTLRFVSWGLNKLATNLPGLAVKLPPEENKFGKMIRRNSWVHVPLDRTHAPPKLPSQLDRLEQQLTRVEAMLLTLTMEGKTL